MAKPPPSEPARGGPALPPGTRPIAQALAANEVLGALTRRVQESSARLAALQPLLPPAMRAAVRAGPLDETGYTLLVGNQAVLAKLRQMLPTLQARLTEQGYGPQPLRLKLLVGG